MLRRSCTAAAGRCAGLGIGAGAWPCGVDRRLGVHIRPEQDVVEERLERSGRLGGDPPHLPASSRPAGSGPAPTRTRNRSPVALRVAQRPVRTLVGDPEAAAQQREAVALVGREQDPREVERVVDQARAEALREQRAEEEQVERPAVSDERGVAAEPVEPVRALGG